MYAMVLVMALTEAQESASHKGYPVTHCCRPHYQGPNVNLNGGYNWPGYACYGGCGGFAGPAYGYPMSPMINPIPPRVYTLAEEEKKLDEELRKKEERKKKAQDDDDDTGKKKRKKDFDDDDQASASSAITIYLPAGAKLSVDGRPVNASRVKTFVTPPLERGATYFYEVTIEVERDGKPVVEKRKLELRAGESVQADYRDPRERATVKRSP